MDKRYLKKVIFCFICVNTFLLTLILFIYNINISNITFANGQLEYSIESEKYEDINEKRKTDIEIYYPQISGLQSEKMRW